MEKPKDYIKYFNEDGTPKRNPYLNEDGGIGDFKKAYIWGDRQNKIKYNQMSEEEKEQYRDMQEHMRDKMNS